MNLTENKQIRIAILDLYEGAENQGMRCIREIINQWGEVHNLNVLFDEFDVRRSKEIPNLSYDIFISTGGPGSPLESEGSDWDNAYFKWFDTVEKWNTDPSNLSRTELNNQLLLYRDLNIIPCWNRHYRRFRLITIELQPALGREIRIQRQLLFNFLNALFISIIAGGASVLPAIIGVLVTSCFATLLRVGWH